jgi:hypothetical protein
VELDGLDGEDLGLVLELDDDARRPVAVDVQLALEAARSSRWISEASSAGGTCSTARSTMAA